MKRIKIADILKEFREGFDFTIEGKGKVIFHNEKIVDYLEERGGAKWFYDTVRELIPSIVCSYKEKENGGCVFTFKSGNSNKKDNKREIEKNFKENTGIDITHHGKNSNGVHVVSEKFKNPEIEEQKNKLIEESMGEKQVDKPEENSNQHFIDDGKGLTYSTEKKDQDKVIEETYYEPRNEEEKKQIIEKNKAEQEKEVNQPNSEVNQVQQDNKNSADNQKQEVSQKTSNNGSGWIWGGGVLGLLGAGGIIVVMKLKSKRIK